MSKANLLLKNDVGLVLDITESPLSCTVYDLEGNEISGGGGGGSDINYCTITIRNTTASYYEFLTMPEIDGHALIVLDSQIFGITLNPNSEVVMTLPFVWGELDDPLIMFMIEAETVTASDAVNCSFETGTPGFIIRTSEGNASITLTV